VSYGGIDYFKWKSGLFFIFSETYPAKLRQFEPTVIHVYFNVVVGEVGPGRITLSYVSS